MVTHDASLTSRTTRNIIIVDGELVDETVARALPWLRHRHLMEFTKLVEKQDFSENSIIVPLGIPVDYFYMIRKGEVEVVLQNSENDEIVISRLKPGEFFGEMDLSHDGKSIMTVRAGAFQPAEVLMLKHEDFQRVIEQSPITKDAMGKIVQPRLDAVHAIESPKR